MSWRSSAGRSPRPSETGPKHLHRQAPGALARFVGGQLGAVPTDAIAPISARMSVLQQVDAAALRRDFDGEAGDLGVEQQGIPANLGPHRLDRPLRDPAAHATPFDPALRSIATVWAGMQLSSHTEPNVVHQRILAPRITG